jgi:hypothetical protein
MVMVSSPVFEDEMEEDVADGANEYKTYNGKKYPANETKHVPDSLHKIVHHAALRFGFARPQRTH